MKKVNFGAGSIQPSGWINIDNDPTFGVDRTMNSIKDNSADMAVAHCALQINDYFEIPKILKELYRVLKDDGVLRISLPDIVEAFRNYESRNIYWFPNGEDNIEDRFCGWLTWYSTTKTLLTVPALGRRLYETGFKQVGETEYKQTGFQYPEIVELDTRPHECYYMEARK